MSMSGAPTKVCTKCGKELPATNEYFSPNPGGRFGLFAACRVCRGIDANKYRLKNPDKRKLYYKDHRDRAIQYSCQYAYDAKISVLSHYGSRCVICGITDPDLLTIDHVNNDGNRETVSGYGLYGRIIAGDFPVGFQVLCWNHNHQKHIDVVRSNQSNDTKAVIQRHVRERLKRLVINHYGGRCQCGEVNIDVLTIDHMNNDGAQHRRSCGINGGTDTYRWLRNNGFPAGFRVSCFNCNSGREIIERRLNGERLHQVSSLVASRVLPTDPSDTRGYTSTDCRKFNKILEHEFGVQNRYYGAVRNGSEKSPVECSGQDGRGYLSGQNDHMDLKLDPPCSNVMAKKPLNSVEVSGGDNTEPDRECRDNGVTTTLPEVISVATAANQLVLVEDIV